MLADLLLAACCAAVPGVPEAPPVEGEPAAWLGWCNDWLGMRGEDDHRTNQFQAGVRLDRLLLAADHSILTQLDAGHGARLDEATVTAGWDLGPVVVGAGWRGRGALGGRSVQNGWHGALGDPQVEAPYQGAAGDAALCYALAEGVWRANRLLSAGGDLAGSVTTDGQAAGDAAGRVLVETGSGRAYLGARLQGRCGGAGAVGAYVDEHEGGLWAEAGLVMEDGGFAVVVEYRQHLGTGASQGGLTLVWLR